jgi:hypothetical protein
VYHIVIRFTAAFEHGSLTCTNNKKAFDPLEDGEVIRIESADVSFVYHQFLQLLRQRSETPRQFPDVESMRRWSDPRQIQVSEERVRRRLFLPMTDQELAEAKARLQSGNPEILSPRPRQSKMKLALWLVIFFAAGGLQYLRYHLHEQSSDTLSYQGRQFKLRKAYATYEDYKDDPDNLNTNELDQIEQAMVNAKIPSSFKNREEYIHNVFDLQFPGYGLASNGSATMTDDGSKLEVSSVEIPQRDKDRYIVVREFGGQLNVVDDFVYPSSTNAIQQIKLQKQKLLYYDKNGKLVREKQL